MSFTFPNHADSTPSDDLDLAQTLRGGGQPMLLGRYRVVRELGRGGMGTVYLAADSKLGDRQVAIKMPAAVLANSKRAVGAMRREAITAMKLSHPGVVTLRSFEEPEQAEGGGVFLVMDYVEGQTLDDYLAEHEKLDEATITALLRPVAEALDYAHQQGVIHRDVKPSNILIDQQGHAKIMDFGIAREMKDTVTRVTGQQDTSGTLPYMSPQQLMGEKAEPSQDIYALGAVLYECLCGHPPFYSGQIDRQISDKEAPSLTDVCGYRGAFAAPIAACLSKRPVDRPSTCVAIFEASSSTNAPSSLTPPPQASARTQVQDTLAPFGEMFSEMFGGGGATASSGPNEAVFEPAPPPVMADHGAKIEHYRALAQQGDAEAQQILGWCYEMGVGVKPDVNAMAYWYGRSADQGNIRAMCGLAMCYGEGLGVPCNHAKSVELCTRSAELGDIQAQHYLGLGYRDGNHVPQDSVKAAYWLRKAAEQGDPPSQTELGCFYSTGEGVPADPAAAAQWYQKAARGGDVYGMVNLGMCYEEGKGVAQDPAVAASLYAAAAERGLPKAQFLLGYCYESGAGRQQDPVEAAVWYRRAAEQGDEEAVAALAKLRQ